MSRAEKLYPRDPSSEFWWAPSDYQPIVDLFGNVAVQVDDDDYQGDSRILYDTGDKVGFMFFGWGSCSGCDWLQSCTSYADVDELIDNMESSITWFDSKQAALEWMLQRDWETQWCWHADEMKDFMRKSLQHLGCEDVDSVMNKLWKREE